MQTKLTLRLEEELISDAKNYARESGKSLSDIVANYFRTLMRSKQGGGQSDAPITTSLRGILGGKTVDESEYHAYLEEKYR